MPPKEKALELAAKSEGYFEPPKKERYYDVPVRMSKREGMIISVSVIARSKELTAEERSWWKEVLADLKKLP